MQGRTGRDARGVNGAPRGKQRCNQPPETQPPCHRRKVSPPAGTPINNKRSNSGASWSIYDGAYDIVAADANYSTFHSVWLPDGTFSAPYIAAAAPYVVTGLTIADDLAFAAGINEPLPTDSHGLGSANAVAGKATEVWAVGYGIFRRR
jgi:hypothetical protein